MSCCALRGREFFESFLTIFQQDAKFSSASHDVAEYIMLCILRTMCSESSQLYSICLQNKIIDTLISPSFLPAMDSSHWSAVAEGEGVRVTNNNYQDYVSVFVRESLFSFLGDLIKYGDEKDKLGEVSHLLTVLANEELDELCCIMVEIESLLHLRFAPVFVTSSVAISTC